MRKQLPGWWHGKGLSLTEEGTSAYKGLIVGVERRGDLIVFYTQKGEFPLRNEPESVENGVKYPGEDESYAIVR
jgi:hypothetical protein